MLTPQLAPNPDHPVHTLERSVKTVVPPVVGVAHIHEQVDGARMGVSFHTEVDHPVFQVLEAQPPTLRLRQADTHPLSVDHLRAIHIVGDLVYDSRHTVPLAEREISRARVAGVEHAHTEKQLPGARHAFSCSPFLAPLIASPVRATERAVVAVQRHISEQQVNDHTCPADDLFVLAEIHQVNERRQVLVVVNVG